MSRKSYRSFVDRVIRALTTLSLRVRNFAIVTYAVPVERVRPHVPARFRLQTFERDREQFCFVSATAFCNEDFRYSALPYPRLTFNESTYRTYVDYDGRQGIYFVGRYLGHPLALAAQRALNRDVWLGDFEIETDLASAGYNSYTCQVRSEQGDTTFALEALRRPEAKPPFDTTEKYVFFITHRLHGLFASSAGFPGYMPVAHVRMQPYEGELRSARFDLWERLGIVEPDEVAQPYSVLVQPAVDFTLFPPRPAL